MTNFSKGVRLNRFLAEAGVASRRKAEELIRQGRVKVNQQVIKELSFRVDPEQDQVEVDGRRIKAQPKAYYLFYKPAGYLTALSDPHGRPTIKEFLQKLPVRVFPVGRLDKDTEGLLLLTNDGLLAQRLLHPRYGLRRVYHARVKGHPAQKALRDLLEHGLEVEGRRVFPKAIKLLGKDRHSTTFEVVIGEGRKREVRKLFAAIGHPVLWLKRVRFGPLCLTGLRPGQIRPLTPKEKRALRQATGL